MADNTGIEYADATWNPVSGCSYGCPNCWARRMAKRLAGRVGYDAEEPFKPGTVHPSRFDQPIRWKRSRRIAVCFMGDLFDPAVSDETIAAVFGVMAAAPQHEFLVLTKRPERMAAWFRRFRSKKKIEEVVDDLTVDGKAPIGCQDRPFPEWPLRNVLVGTSVSTQKDADERIPELLKCPGRRWVSAEPLLESVLPTLCRTMSVEEVRTLIEEQPSVLEECPGLLDVAKDGGALEPAVNWVVCGGESGPNARPTHPFWVRSLRAQCETTNTPFVFKQWGAWAPYDDDHGSTSRIGDWTEVEHGLTLYPSGRFVRSPHKETVVDKGVTMVNVGKKTAGRILDGKIHNDGPRP